MLRLMVTAGRAAAVGAACLAAPMAASLAASLVRMLSFSVRDEADTCSCTQGTQLVLENGGMRLSLCYGSEQTVSKRNAANQRCKIGAWEDAVDATVSSTAT